jgi:hypothetical protein
MGLEKLSKILESLNFEELKEAKDLVNTYYKQAKKDKGAKRLVDTHYNQLGVYFRLEKVFCNKSNCKKCQGEDKEGHGPYWYSYKNGKREYIGKKRKEELNKVNKLSRIMVKNKDTKLPYKR